MNPPSTKPYLIRAIYEWCLECDYTPILSVKVDPEGESMNVPKDSIKNGEIILNIDHNAVRNLNIGNDIISFSARFNGISKEIFFSVDTVKGIFAQEINQGIAFPEVTNKKDTIEKTNEKQIEETVTNPKKSGTSKRSKASLHLIK